MARRVPRRGKESRFGSFGISTPGSSPNHGKTRFLRALPHAGDKCSCSRCDSIREDNAAARRSVNWPSDYPPSFYSRSNRRSFFGDEQLPRMTRGGTPTPGNWDAIF